MPQVGTFTLHLSCDHAHPYDGIHYDRLNPAEYATTNTAQNVANRHAGMGGS